MMNSGGDPVVVSTVVVGLEVVDVARKSFKISFRVFGFSVNENRKLFLNFVILVFYGTSNWWG